MASARHLLVGDLAAGVGVDHPVDLLVGQRAAVPLGADDVDRVERARSRAVLAQVVGRRRRPAAPRVIGRMPLGVSSSRSGPPCSQSSCRQRPHGISSSPCPSTQVTRHQPAAAGGVQRRDQAALGAQPQAVRGVLDVAAGDDPAVVDQRRPRRPGSCEYGA